MEHTICKNTHNDKHVIPKSKSGIEQEISESSLDEEHIIVDIISEENQGVSNEEYIVVDNTSDEKQIISGVSSNRGSVITANMPEGNQDMHGSSSHDEYAITQNAPGEKHVIMTNKEKGRQTMSYLERLLLSEKTEYENYSIPEKTPGRKHAVCGHKLGKKHLKSEDTSDKRRAILGNTVDEQHNILKNSLGGERVVSGNTLNEEHIVSEASWKLDDQQLASMFKLSERPSTSGITSDGKSIFPKNKFGGTHVTPVNATIENIEMHKKAACAHKCRKLICGMPHKMGISKGVSCQLDDFGDKKRDKLHTTSGTGSNEKPFVSKTVFCEKDVITDTRPGKKHGILETVPGEERTISKNGPDDKNAISGAGHSEKNATAGTRLSGKHSISANALDEQGIPENLFHEGPLVYQLDEKDIDWNDPDVEIVNSGMFLGTSARVIIRLNHRTNMYECIHERRRNGNDEVNQRTVDADKYSAMRAICEPTSSEMHNTSGGGPDQKHAVAEAAFSEENVILGTGVGEKHRTVPGEECVIPETGPGDKDVVSATGSGEKHVISETESGDIDVISGAGPSEKNDTPGTGLSGNHNFSVKTLGVDGSVEKHTASTGMSNEKRTSWKNGPNAMSVGERLLNRGSRATEPASVSKGRAKTKNISADSNCR